MNKRNRQFGVGLLEILISILIGAILVIAITTMYGNFAAANQVQLEQSTAQDQANFAFIDLNRAVRMAGAGLCVNPSIDSKDYVHQAPDFRSEFPNIIPNNLTTFNAASRLHSFEITNGNKAELGTSYKVKVGSDALLVIYSGSKTRQLKDIVDASGAVIAPENASPYHPRRLLTSRSAEDPLFKYAEGSAGGDIETTWIMLSDCSHTGIFKYEKGDVERNILHPPAASGGSFLYNFGSNKQTILAARLYAFLYYVAEDSKGDSMLYRKDLLNSLGHGTNGEPIAAYVTNMQIRYKDGTNWVNAADRTASNNWDKNFPVRITLTLNTGPQLGAQEYTRILGVRN